MYTCSKYHYYPKSMIPESRSSKSNAALCHPMVLHMYRIWIKFHTHHQLTIISFIYVYKIFVEKMFALKKIRTVRIEQHFFTSRARVASGC